MPIAYRATLGRVNLRIVAYHHPPMPDNHLKVVVQVVDGPILLAEDPIHTETMHELDLARALHLSLCEGWDLKPWN